MSSPVLTLAKPHSTVSTADYRHGYDDGHIMPEAFFWQTAQAIKTPKEKLDAQAKLDKESYYWQQWVAIH